MTVEEARQKSKDGLQEQIDHYIRVQKGHIDYAIDRGDNKCYFLYQCDVSDVIFNAVKEYYIERGFNFIPYSDIDLDKCPRLTW